MALYKYGTIYKVYRYLKYFTLNLDHEALIYRAP